MRLNSEWRGPDWLDLSAMIAALKTLHGVSIHVEMRAGDVEELARWVVTLLAVSDVAELGSPPKTYRWSQKCGDNDMSHVAAVLYNGCYELEKLLQAGQWVQMELPK